MDDILTSVKKSIGIAPDNYYFDPELVLHINSVFSVLRQIGVGPSDGFMLEDDKTSYWSDYISDDAKKLQLVKTYISLKVKLWFDPPINSGILSAMERQVSELEWRLSVQVDPGNLP